MEVRFSAASRMGHIPVISKPAWQTRLPAVQTPATTDAFVRINRQKPVEAIARERTLLARPPVVDYRAAAFSTKAALAFMAAPLFKTVV